MEKDGNTDTTDDFPGRFGSTKTNESSNLLKDSYFTKEDDTMAVMAKPRTALPVIDAQNSRKFITESNKKKLTSSFLETCKKSSSLFKKEF